MTDDNPKVVELLRLIQVLFETLISQGIKYCSEEMKKTRAILHGFDTTCQCLVHDTVPEPQASR